LEKPGFSHTFGAREKPGFLEKPGFFHTFGAREKPGFSKKPGFWTNLCVKDGSGDLSYRKMTSAAA